MFTKLLFLKYGTWIIYALCPSSFAFSHLSCLCHRWLVGSQSEQWWWCRMLFLNKLDLRVQMWPDLIFLSQLEVAEHSSLKVKKFATCDYFINWTSQLKWAIMFCVIVQWFDRKYIAVIFVLQRPSLCSLAVTLFSCFSVSISYSTVRN